MPTAAAPFAQTRAAPPRLVRDGETPSAAAGPAVADLPPEARDRLRALRRWAVSAQLSPRIDLPRACALIGPPGAVAPERLGPLLLEALAEDGGRPARLHRPRSAGVSSDERWLLAVLERQRAGDVDSVRFLIGRRIAPRARRLARFLAARLAEALPETSPSN